ncbi:MAG: hypothetical protein HY901_23815, partial [Deltaproteobacteria bacterium]|nr:hypothetical protein [Deltaproteobacteria bacterium]
RFRRARWTRSQALVALDRAAGAGGLGLALAEVDAPPWQPLLSEKLAAAHLPPRELGRPLVAILLAAAFAVAALLVPRHVGLVPAIQAAAESHVTDAELKAEALAAEEPLDAVLQAELERLRQEAESGRFDAADWAALDAVGEALDQAGAERAAQLAQAESAAHQLGEALDRNAGGEAEQRAREALEDALMALGAEKLGGQEEKANPSGEAGQQGAATAGEKAGEPKQGKPGTPKTGADAKELAKALAARRQALEKGAGTTGWSKSQQQGSGGKQGQSMYGQGHGLGEGQGSDGKGEYGSGSPTRGPGAAPVTFGPQHPIDPDQLQAQALPKGEGDDPSDLEGIRPMAPKPGQAGPSGTLGAPAAGPDGLVPESAPLAPRHRDLVKRYFDKKNPGGK